MELSNYSKIFKALSNEKRLKIFLMVYKCCKGGGGEGQKQRESCCEGSLEKAFSMACGCLDLSKSTISHHFKELENAGLIISEREGQAFRCRINEDAVNAIRELLK